MKKIIKGILFWTLFVIGVLILPEFMHSVHQILYVNAVFISVLFVILISVKDRTRKRATVTALFVFLTLTIGFSLARWLELSLVGPDGNMEVFDRCTSELTKKGETLHDAWAKCGLSQ